MPLPIWPTSPVPAGINRTPFWGDSVQEYDSGLSQGSTAFSKPLMRYSLSFNNMARIRQNSLSALYNACRGGVLPFLFKDPYDFRANATICVRTGTAVRSFFVVTAEGYPVIPQSGTLRITSTLSGVLTQGTHYSFNQDTGVFSTHIAPSSADFWVASCEYFRKCRFQSYSDASPISDIFNGQAAWVETALP